MSFEQSSVFIILFLAMCLFVWNHWRYDVVAGIALLASVFIGIVHADEAFDGFSHPAVITVACVLVISKALQASGIVEVFLRFLAHSRKTMTQQLIANCGMAGLLSAFMNNVGALALMLPVSMRDAAKAKRPASKLLMPLSFASLLGGLVTLIGTPPNIIIATFRAESQGEPFGMFDFAPVGLVVALFGLLYLVTLGWRLIPGQANENEDETDRFQVTRYLTEARVLAGSSLIGSNVGDLEKFCENDIAVMAIFRRMGNRLAPSTHEEIREDDVIILQGEHESLQPLFDNPGMVEIGAKNASNDFLKSEDVQLLEAVVMPNAMIEGQSMRGLRIHDQYGVNLLAVARHGNAPMSRLGRVRFKTGDVILLQGESGTLEQVIKSFGCLPLAKRIKEVTIKKRLFVTPAIFAAGIIAAAMGVVPVQIAFATCVAALILTNSVTLRDAYRSVEWPIIVLLGCLIPIGEALHTTGATMLIANGILGISGDMPLWMLITVLLVTSMLLSDLVHNSPTAVLMAPIAISLADGLQISPDPFLMAVAVGAASPYLTPIGHQSNTLVMGPGGYNFGDYWRVGLPLDLVIVTVAVPMIMLVWG